MTALGLRLGLRKSLIIILFLAASLLRLADAFRPIDKASWRECDLGSISRNFVQEGMNPFYPRVDWRGDGPGYAEMELPLYPYLIAITYKVFGIHDYFGRIWACLFSLGTMFFFFRLAREYLSLFASTVAFAFFALNPLMVELSTAVQPEGLMILTYIASVYFFIKWLKSEKNSFFWAALVFTAFTLLSKAPAAHIGLLFGVLLIEKYGWKVFREAKVWIFGIFATLPSLLWYFHAKNLWILYGNSLGVSNEYHWIGWDFFTDPNFFQGILRTEFLDVWLVFGIVAGAFAIWRGYNEELSRNSLLWLASIFTFYIVAARTTSENWAYYYHVFSIPPVALIFGLSIKKLWDFAREFADTYSRQALMERLIRVAIMAVLLVGIMASLLLEAKQLRDKLDENRIEVQSYSFAQRVKPLMTTDGLILASGGHNQNPKGYQLAYNSSYFFYWLGRKGWNIAVEDQSLARVRDFARKGAVAFVAEKKFLALAPRFETELRQAYPVTTEDHDFLLFDLTAGRDLPVKQ